MDTIPFTLLDYQEEALTFLKDTNKKYGFAILADETGVGKTHPVCKLIYDAVKNPEMKCFVVCPLILKEQNWIPLLKSMPNIKLLCLDAGNSKKTFKSSDLDNYNVIITNYEKLDAIKKGSSHKGFNKWYSSKKANNNNIIVFDEVHKAKSLTSAIGKAVSIYAYHSKYVIGMTGTLVHDRAEDVYTTIYALNKDWANVIAYHADNFIQKYFYCMKKFFYINGRSNEKLIATAIDEKKAEKLKKYLGAVVLRRTKKQVKAIDDSIKLQYYHYNVNEVPFLTPDQKEQLSREYYESKAQQDNQAQSYFGLITNDTQVLLEVRKKAVEDIMRKHEGEKVVVFCLRTKSVQGIGGYLNVPCLDGSCTPAKKNTILTDFKTPQGNNVLVCQTKVAGTGLNLTEASVVVFVESDISLGESKQAIDRVYRKGQNRDVTVYSLIYNNSDKANVCSNSKTEKMMFRKKNIADDIYKLIPSQYGI